MVNDDDDNDGNNQLDNVEEGMGRQVRFGVWAIENFLNTCCSLGIPQQLKVQTSNKPNSSFNTFSVAGLISLRRLSVFVGAPVTPGDGEDVVEVEVEEVLLFAAAICLLFCRFLELISPGNSCALRHRSTWAWYLWRRLGRSPA